MVSLLKKLIGSRNDRLLKEYRKQVAQINSLEPKISALSDEELSAKTQEFRDRHQQGTSLDDLLPEAFAVVREAGKRVFGMRHFDVQMLGGIALHNGKIAEMRTGEGKTLMATLPVYLNAIAGKGVHVVTVNDYLARRDAEWMGRLYRFLGMSTGVVVPQQPNDEKIAAYAADITYGTNNEFGFDYLRDNMEYRVEDRRQRRLFYAIVDEVDSILIDEARTPLIISGQAEDHTELYVRMNAVPPLLKRMASEPKPHEPEPEGDYWVDEKSQQVYMSEAGHESAEKILTRVGLLPEGESLYDPRHIALMHHMMVALRAHTLFFRDQQYVVQDDEVVIVDEFTGRLMVGRRWSDGLHQAVEAKEGVKIQHENQTLASITFQNYFRMYDKLSGMTGTADTEAYEFQEIYTLETVIIPTNKPMVRKDQNDQVFKTTQEKYQAILNDIRDCHERGQPVLVGTTSIENSELLAGLLRQAKLPHEVLNAKQHAREAEIVAEAGKPGHITIATNMAGRGTDIVLGEGVLELGGLHILGTERHESRRIDNQLRGRSGRQGDPGSSRFYLSLEDDLMRLFGSDRISGLMEKLGLKDGEAIENAMVTRAVESAQKRVEAHHFEIRKTLLDYDNVMNQQREVIYTLRRDMMVEEDLEPVLSEFRNDILDDAYTPLEQADTDTAIELRKALQARLADVFNLGRVLAADAPVPDRAGCEECIHQIFQQLREEAGPLYQDILRYFLLEELDRTWKEHLRNMDALRDGIGLRGYGQKAPKLEYKREGFEMFQSMLFQIREGVFRALTRVHVQPAEPAPAEGAVEEGNAPAEAPQQEAPKAKPTLSLRHKENDDLAYSGSQTTDAGNQPAKAKPRVGRNDPCPCGSGKKYKKCCGMGKV